MRGLPGLEKQPATGELIAWVKVLLHAGVDPDALDKAPLADLPFPGAVIKTRQDRRVLLEAAS